MSGSKISLSRIRLFQVDQGRMGKKEGPEGQIRALVAIALVVVAIGGGGGGKRREEKKEEDERVGIRKFHIEQRSGTCAISPSVAVCHHSLN